jgi:hypothetical protein
MFNECFWKVFIHWIFFKLIHIFHWYIIKKLLYFQHQIKLPLLNVKKEHMLHLLCLMLM